jgi:hypothetical protein
MPTPRKASARRRKIAPVPPRRQPQVNREGAIVVAAVGVIVAVLGHAAMGIGIVAVAAIVFLLGLLAPSR